MKKLLISILCGLFVLYSISVVAAVDDDSVFDLEVCGNQTSLAFENCGLFSGYLTNSALDVPSEITFIVDATYNSFCTVSFGLESGTISRVEINGDRLRKNTDSTFSGDLTFSQNSNINIQGNSFAISSMDIHCSNTAVSISVDRPDYVQEGKYVEIISNPDVSESFGRLAEWHSLSPVGNINTSSLQMPSFCETRYLGNLYIICEQDDVFNDYIISFKTSGDVSHSLIQNYDVETNFFLFADIRNSLSSKTIEFVAKPSILDLGVVTRFQTQRGYISSKDLIFQDTILGVEANCPDSNSATVSIGNRQKGFTCQYFSNFRTPDGFFFIELSSDNLQSNPALCPSPFVIEYSGLYDIDVSCDISGNFCSGPCYQPLPNPLPIDFNSWLPWFDIGKTIFDFFSSNEIPDCVCSDDGQLEPIRKVTSVEPLRINESSNITNSQPRVIIDVISPTDFSTTTTTTATLEYRITCDSAVDCTDIELDFPFPDTIQLVSGAQTETVTIASRDSIIRTFDVQRKP